MGRKSTCGHGISSANSRPFRPVVARSGSVPSGCQNMTGPSGDTMANGGALRQGADELRAAGADHRVPMDAAVVVVRPTNLRGELLDGVRMFLRLTVRVLGIQRVREAGNRFLLFSSRHSACSVTT
jgi:hypothetical protein